ncbi:hypothetical protein D3C80_1951720 [compost metagenome]
MAPNNAQVNEIHAFHLQNDDSLFASGSNDGCIHWLYLLLHADRFADRDGRDQCQNRDGAGQKQYKVSDG